MANRSEPNAQNSEINPQAHPSGARIERLMKNAAEARTSALADGAGDQGGRGPYGELLRPSEREDAVQTPSEDLEAEPTHTPGQSPHRGHRNSREH